MSNLLTQIAYEAYKKGNYVEALDIYKKLGSILGLRGFGVNINLCEKKLRSELRRDITRLPLNQLKVASIMDEFTYLSYAPECNLFQLSTDDPINELERFMPDLLFVESAWRGKNDQWNKKVGSLSQELKAVLNWCKSNFVPTVFWNKEDPIHFETFLTTAQQFDHIFTTDIDCIARYKSALGHEQVYLLPFACQPSIHNPIELYERKDAFCFAGAYYVRYPGRTKDLESYISKFPKYKPLEIFDRNFGKDDQNYKFPEIYQSYIVGTLPFNEIDRAYKGYNYSINLNSIKQSQTMFARRVYELLGSNTLTVSNFSRGIRLLFGDLVVCSDNGDEIISCLTNFENSKKLKLKLAALRKVMLEHTYQNRLSYVARKALAWCPDKDLPFIAIYAIVKTDGDYFKIVKNFKSQTYQRKCLIIIANDGSMKNKISDHIDSNVNILQPNEVNSFHIANVDGRADWVGVMSASDYYGKNYLLDLAISTKYKKDICAIGKGGYYRVIDKSINLLLPELVYRINQSFSIRSSIFNKVIFRNKSSILSWINEYSEKDFGAEGLAIDQFNYCRDAYISGIEIDLVKLHVDDIDVDVGISVEDLIANSEKIRPTANDSKIARKWSSSNLFEMFSTLNNLHIKISLEGSALGIASSLDDAKHEYIYGKDLFQVSSISHKNNDVMCRLDATPGLDVQYVFVFYDEKRERLGYSMHVANKNQTFNIPLRGQYFRFGFRVSGSGFVQINSLEWGHRKLEPSILLGRADTLLLTNNYPSYDDLYRNGFVHSRVKSYEESNLKVDVFRFRSNETVSYHEFKNVDVISGGELALKKLLDVGVYKRVLIHFLTPQMWSVLKDYPNISLIVWVHGSEIQPWHRRDYNYTNDQERAKAIVESDLRIGFWRTILNPRPKNLKLVFVSKYFAEEVFEDLGFRLSDDGYEIIHNPIDVNLFSYVPKSAEQRKKILSIRPYASRKYANDLTVKAILELSKKPFFNDLEFRIIGDGALFDELLSPLKGFANINIERRFLSHPEIAALHKEYGVCLTPTRMDAQGVSRDEAMASGLVPITNSVAAIPEFVDDKCGVLVDGEDFLALANGVEYLYKNPDKFLELSRNASFRVRKQCSSEELIGKEIRLFMTEF